MKRFLLPGIVVGVIFLAAVWWLALTRTLPPPAATAESASTTPARPRESPAPSKDVGVVAIPDPRDALKRPLTLPVASQLLRDQIRDATDLRALYERTKDLPDPTGERAYRMAEAIFECSVFVDSPPEELSARLALNKAARESARRQEVFNFMVERCKGFAGNAAALREITPALHKRAEAAGFPAEIARTLRQDPAVRDFERADEVAIRLFATPDPDVVHELAQYLNLRNLHNPQFRSGGAATRSIAWGLLECQYGGECGPRSRPVVMTCITLGACDLQRVEEAVLAQGSQAVVNNAVQMRDRLAREIAARDWAALGLTDRTKAP